MRQENLSSSCNDDVIHVGEKVNFVNLYTVVLVPAKQCYPGTHPYKILPIPSRCLILVLTEKNIHL